MLIEPNQEARMAWEKKPAETAVAFQAFAVYRDMGLGIRSNAKVAEELGKSVTLINRWSSRWEWVDRVDEYDQFLDKEFRDRHQKELYEARDRHANLARLFQTKFLERLMDVPSSQIPMTQMASILKVATEVELRALGEATLKTETEISGADGGPLRLSIDELARTLQYDDNFTTDHVGGGNSPPQLE